MCSLFRNKYRNETFRLPGNDYSYTGNYYVTICTCRRLPYFGNILYEKMILSESGYIATEIWYELPKHFPFILLDEFVVMPNHIHGIIKIVGTLHDGVGTLHATSLHSQPKQKGFMSLISPKSGSLPTVIRSYKSAVSKKVHLIDSDFSWQPRYYDYIIRSDRELDRIRNYIINNPANWDAQWH